MLSEPETVEKFIKDSETVDKLRATFVDIHAITVCLFSFFYLSAQCIMLCSNSSEFEIEQKKNKNESDYKG